MTSPRLKRFLLVILGPVVVLGAVELGLRVFGIGYPTAFLVPREIAGRRVFVDNPFFGYRFFPQRMTRTSAPIVLDRNKAPDTVRVFILGESAAMGEPQSEFGLARFLEILLEGRVPGKRFEVVNAAMTAINSHVIADIARELASHEPDVFVIYAGNNEVVGPYGPGTVFEASGRFTRLRVALTRFRLPQFLRARASGPRWSGMEMFQERRVAAGDERLDHVYNGFQANLNRIMASARKAGASVVLSTVAVNVRDCPPFAGDQARELYGEGRFAEARDLDELRFRADSVINQITRNLGQWAGSGVQLVDAAASFGEAGDEFFIDHVHFTPAGNYALACAVADRIAAATAPAPTLEECLDRMTYSPWNEWDVVDSMILRRQRAPFTGQPGNADALKRLQQRRRDLVESLTPAATEAMRIRIERARAQDPRTWRAPMQWAEVLMNTGDHEGAARALREAVAALPHRFDVRAGLALGYQGRAAEGVAALRDAPRPHGHFVGEFLLIEARNLAQDGRLDVAHAFAEAAVEEAPDSADALIELAIRCSALGRYNEAEQFHREAWMRWPDYPAARDEWAGFLALHQRWDEAERVLLSGGDLPETRLKQAQLLAARGDLAGAEQGLRNLLASGEASAELYVTLARVQARQGRTRDAKASVDRALELDPTHAASRDLAERLAAEAVPASP